MEVFKRFFGLLGLSLPTSDGDVRAALEEFDCYSQHLLLVVDPQWDASTRMLNVEYCAFLHGATLAILRSYGQDDEHSGSVLGRYLSCFMDWEFSLGWLQNCEAELRCSPRLQSLEAAGSHTAQAVLLASSGPSDFLQRPQNFQVLMEIFAEVRNLMNDRVATNERLLEANGKLHQCVVGA